VIKIRLSETDPTILVFDGEILECFFMDGSKRIHITHIKGFQFESNTKGKYLLTIKLKYDPLLLWVDESSVAKVNELIAQVQSSMASFKI
jgi:hypothetical protein